MTDSSTSRLMWCGPARLRGHARRPYFAHRRAGLTVIRVGGYVFISYSHGDLEYIEQLKRHLIEAGLTAWTDSGIDYGSQWPATIAKQIDDCAAFVPVMSPRSRESAWVRREILYAQEVIKPILPLLLEATRFIELIDVQDEAVIGGRLPGTRFINRLRTLVEVSDAHARSSKLAPADHAPLRGAAEPEAARAEPGTPAAPVRKAEPTAQRTAMQHARDAARASHEAASRTPRPRGPKG